MPPEKWMAGVLGAALWAAQGSPEAADFLKRVDSYVKIRKNAISGVGSLKATDSPERIQEHQRELSQAIRGARPDAKQGDILSPAIADDFRKLIRAALVSPGARRIRKALTDTPVSPLPAIGVNAAYPMNQPVASMPPSLLQKLPELPRGILEYRFVGRTLILRDVEANLIVDYVNEAIP